MSGIGIVGAGVAGLHLGLKLQASNIPVTIYTDRTSEQLRESRLPNTVALLHATLEHDRALGVNHWDSSDFGLFAGYLNIVADPPLSFEARLDQPGIFIDMRMYLGQLLEDFEQRGGHVVYGALDAAAIERLSEQHELMVISAGRGTTLDLFPVLEQHTPFQQPQRVLLAALFRGITFPETLGMTFNIVPGQGEIFENQFLTFEGPVNGLLIEALPGSELAELARTPYEADPQAFNQTILDLLRRYAPAVYERTDPEQFGLLGPLDLLQGGVKPVVRRGYTQLGSGRYALALGDVHVTNDPITGQGANAASHSAWLAADLILEALGQGEPFGQAFCARVEARLWERLRYVTEWSNMQLQPPAPHVQLLMFAASQSPAVAHAFLNNFNRPEKMWEISSSPEAMMTFLAELGWAAPPMDAVPA